jgi:crotonobetainyl-CoA:carnitine CoA-transferase CaiB-like acyl-CoA transferase
VSVAQAVPFVQTKCTGVEPRRVGLRHPSIAPYGAFSCADGRKLLISIQNEREWASLCAHVLGDADMERDERFRTSTLRVANRAALDERVQACFAQSAAEDLKKRLLDAGIAFGQLSSVTDLTKHPQLRTVSYKSEVGSVVEMPAPAILPHADRLGDAPRLGQHTAAILAEFAACAAPGGDGSSSSSTKVHN